MAEVTWGERLQDVNTDGGFEVLPSGVYNFVIRSVKTKTSSKGDPQLGVYCAVVDGPLAGKAAYDMMTWTENGAWAVLSNLAVIGITKDYLKEHNPSWEQIAEAMVNQTFTAEVGPREWPVGSGNMRTNFELWKQYQGPPLQQQQTQAAPAPAAPAPAQSTPPPAPATPQSPAAPATNDEAPF